MIVRLISIFIILLMLPDCAYAQFQRSGINVLRGAELLFLRGKLNKEQKKRLQPDVRDLKKYEAFLQNPKTGIFRLMPDLGCTENINILKADAACLNFIPESSYYSFREREYTPQFLADIRLIKGFLVTDGILSQGIVAHLGDVDLEKLEATSDGLDFISNFAPHRQGVEAQKQFMQVARGVKVGQYEYKKVVPVVENGTYVLRVVAYRSSVYRRIRGFAFDILSGDKRIDMTIAFRVVRTEQDGGATLLWKEIARRQSPRIILPKRKI